jgi:hypothetical protein
MSRVAKRVPRGKRKPICVGASHEVLHEIWWGLLWACVDVLNQPFGATAQELSFVRAFIHDQGFTAASIRDMRGALSKIAQAALAQPFELKQTGSSLGARHDDGNDDKE